MSQSEISNQIENFEKDYVPNCMGSFSSEMQQCFQVLHQDYVGVGFPCRLSSYAPCYCCCFIIVSFQLI